MSEVYNSPIGTLREVKQLGLSPIRTGSCSQPTKRNKGCEHFNHPERGPCPILALLHKRGRPGVEFVAFLRVKSRTNWKKDAVLCHQYMDTFHRSDPRNGLVQILGFGGDVTIERRGTTEDPKNPRNRVKTLRSEKVQRYVRPTESMSDVEKMGTMAADMARLQGLDATLAAIGHPTFAGVQSQPVTVDPDAAKGLETMDEDDLDEGAVAADVELDDDDFDGEDLDDATETGDVPAGDAVLDD